MKSNIAVIGGGWSGCAAAVELAGLGHHVVLFEAARTLGGRARRVEWQGLRLDNGQHILLGAYMESLRLMKKVGLDPKQSMLRLPLQMRYPPGTGGMDFIAATLPAPLHLLIALLRARGLDMQDKLAIARFSSTARWIDWRLNIDCTVAEMMRRYDQTERLIRLLWRPLCIAALNTPPEQASAQVFLNVLRDSFGARRQASEMLLPKVDLSRLFPERAGEFVEQHGGKIKTGSAVRKIMQDAKGWQIDAGDTLQTSHAFDAVIVATQPAQAGPLLQGLLPEPVTAGFTYAPITTCYLQYDEAVRLPQPFFALLDFPEAGEWGQFVFDKGQADASQRGVLAVVVSAAEHAILMDQGELAGMIARQLAKAFCMPELAVPIKTKVISEKRATFTCTPGLMRPSNATGLKGLFLAGDYTQSDYPATLESAVRSGVAAARAADAGIAA